jgi:hypothetical protein
MMKSAVFLILFLFSLSHARGPNLGGYDAFSNMGPSLSSRLPSERPVGSTIKTALLADIESRPVSYPKVPVSLECSPRDPGFSGSRV